MRARAPAMATTPGPLDPLPDSPPGGGRAEGAPADGGVALAVGVAVGVSVRPGVAVGVGVGVSVGPGVAVGVGVGVSVSVGVGVGTMKLPALRKTTESRMESLASAMASFIWLVAPTSTDAV